MPDTAGQLSYTVRPLDSSAWDAFADLVERNNGIYGGCWCIGYHPECEQRGINHQAVKEKRVRTGRAHAAFVLDEAGRSGVVSVRQPRGARRDQAQATAQVP